jgi:hypothetical protein
MILKRMTGLIVLLVCSITWLTPAYAASTPKPQSVRALHFVLWGASVADAKRITDLAKSSGFNTLVISLGNAVKFRSLPGKLRPGAWSVDELMTFVNYAKQLGLNVIPQINLLTHQEMFFGNSHPDLMFNISTYDPRKPEVYKLVTTYIDEIISVLHPSAIHIGHDELKGFLLERNIFSNEVIGWLLGEHSLPSKLFLLDVLHIHDYLSARRIETWMWGDMLISPKEFPEMLAWRLHGGALGYGKTLRTEIPRDIVICDWHYSDDQPDFPSLAAMQNEGFRVIGSTWKTSKTTQAFSRYAAQHAAYGMMATTWIQVPSKEWDVTERIIRESGEAFSKDFPDTK